MFSMKYLKELSYNFIDADIFPSLDHISHHLKHIYLHQFFVKKYGRIKIVKF